MARYTGPKLKKSRRVGQDLGHKQNLQKVARRLNIPPGHHGQRRGRGKRVSEYGQQLMEKQKAKFIYGVLERQFCRYVKQAQRNPQATGEELIRILERRLDNVVFRLGFAPTRPLARQLVGHGHISINNQKTSIPSYQVSPGEIITVSVRAANIPTVQQKLSDKEYKTPLWMQKKGPAGKITRLPEKDDLESLIDQQSIVEFYSR